MSLLSDEVTRDWHHTIQFKLDACRVVRTGPALTAVLRPRAVVSEHRRLYEAVDRRDATGADGAVRDHLAAAGDALLALCYPEENAKSSTHL